MFLSLLLPPQKVAGRYKTLQRGLNFVLLDTAQEKSKKVFVSTLANSFNFWYHLLAHLKENNPSDNKDNKSLHSQNTTISQNMFILFQGRLSHLIIKQ